MKQEEMKKKMLEEKNESHPLHTNASSTPNPMTSWQKHTSKVNTKTGTTSKVNTKTGTTSKVNTKTGTTSKTGTTWKVNTKTGATSKVNTKTGTTSKVNTKTGTASVPETVTCSFLTEQMKYFFCPYCPAKFPSMSMLERHMRRHTGEKPWSCDLCGVKFTRNEHKNRHMKAQHEKTD